MEPSTSVFTEIISNIGEFVTGAVSWIGSTIAVFSSHPILMLPMYIGFIGVGFGLIRRAVRTFR